MPLSFSESCPMLAVGTRVAASVGGLEVEAAAVMRVDTGGAVVEFPEDIGGAIEAAVVSGEVSAAVSDRA